MSLSAFNLFIYLFIYLDDNKSKVTHLLSQSLDAVLEKRLYVFIQYTVYITSTHNLCFRAKVRKIYSPVNPSFILYKFIPLADIFS